MAQPDESMAEVGFEQGASQFTLLVFTIMPATSVSESGTALCLILASTKA